VDLSYSFKNSHCYYFWNVKLEITGRLLFSKIISNSLQVGFVNEHKQFLEYLNDPLKKNLGPFEHFSAFFVKRLNGLIIEQVRQIRVTFFNARFLERGMLKSISWILLNKRDLTMYFVGCFKTPSEPEKNFLECSEIIHA
jgi:hypothetical protein